MTSVKTQYKLYQAFIRIIILLLEHEDKVLVRLWSIYMKTMQYKWSLSHPITVIKLIKTHTGFVSFRYTTNITFRWFIYCINFFLHSASLNHLHTLNPNKKTLKVETEFMSCIFTRDGGIYSEMHNAWIPLTWNYNSTVLLLQRENRHTL